MPRSALDRFSFRRVAIVMAVIGVSIAASYFLSVEVRRDQTEAAQSDYRQILQGYASRIKAHVQTRFEAAYFVAEQVLAERPAGHEDFIALTAPPRRLFSDIQAISWVDPGGVIRWVTPLEGNRDAVGLNIRAMQVPAQILARSRRDGVLALTPPLELAQAGRGFVGYLPIGEHPDRDGYVNLVFRLKPLVEEAISDLGGSNFVISITDAGAEVFTAAIKAPDAPTLASQDLALQNRIWTVSLHNAGPVAAPVGGHIDGLVLSVGLVFSGLLGLAAFLLLQWQQRLANGEERFRDFASVNSDWFWETDATMRLTYLSDRFEDVVGEPAAKFLGKTREEVGAPGADEHVFRDHLETLARREPFSDFVFNRVHASRGPVTLSLSGKPVYVDGEFRGYRGSGKDITDKRDQDQKLRDAVETAIRANRAKSEFLATMSHELRTPLNAIIGFSDMMRREMYGPLGSPQYGSYVRDIHDSGGHLLALINDILDISAIEAGKRPLVFEPIDISEVLTESEKFFTELARESGVSVIVGDRAAHRTVFADRKAMKQIFINIIVNAIKYNRVDGSVFIDCGFERGAFVFCVRDTGLGIPADTLPTITEPFARSHMDPHIAHGGTGLGLSIVDALVSAHRGVLQIDSAEGSGTTVEIRIPVEEAAAEKAVAS